MKKKVIFLMILMIGFCVLPFALPASEGIPDQSEPTYDISCCHDLDITVDDPTPIDIESYFQIDVMKLYFEIKQVHYKLTICMIDESFYTATIQEDPGRAKPILKLPYLL